MWYLASLTIAGLVYGLYRYANYSTVMSVIQLSQYISKEPSLAEHVSMNIYSVSYIHHGQVYKIYFPIRDSVKNQLKGYDVFLTCGGYDFIEVNQEPGVPYFVSKEDLPETMSLIAISEDESITLV